MAKIDYPLYVCKNPHGNLTDPRYCELCETLVELITYTGVDEYGRVLIEYGPCGCIQECRQDDWVS